VRKGPATVEAPELKPGGDPEALRRDAQPHRPVQQPLEGRQPPVVVAPDQEQPVGRAASHWRGLEESKVLAVATDPEQTVELERGREVRQSWVEGPGETAPYLVRVVVEVLPKETVIVTAYRTSKIGKYWRLP